MDFDQVTLSSLNRHAVATREGIVLTLTHHPYPNPGLFFFFFTLILTITLTNPEPQDVGTFKVVSVEKHLKDIIPFCQVEAMPLRFDRDTIETILKGKPGYIF